MKRFLTVFSLLSFFSIVSVQVCFSQSQWSLSKSYNLPHSIQGVDCNDDYFFVKSNDTIHAYDVLTGSLIHSEKTGFDNWSFIVINNKLFARQWPDILRYYDISNITNWSLVQTLTGFDNGWVTKLTNDTNYIAWVGHWASTYQIIDITGANMNLKCKVNTGGNSYGGGSYGNYIFVSNAYSQSTKIDISNPTSCTVSNFGASAVNGCYTTQTGLVVHDEGYASPNRIKIYNQSNTLTGQTTVDSEVHYVLPDNYCIVLNPSTLDNVVYDISDGTFNHPIQTIFNRNYSSITHNNKYLIVSNNSILEFYNRLSCSNSQSNDTITYFVSSPEFQSNSPKIVFENTDSLTTQVGGCDSIVNHFSKFVYNPTYCSVTDTLIIDVTITGVPSPNNINTLKIYPNPANTFVIINTGNYSTMSNYTIRIENMLGQQVFQTLTNQQEFQIDVNSFGGTGTYIVKIIDNTSNVITTRKIILN